MPHMPLDYLLYSSRNQGDVIIFSFYKINPAKFQTFSFFCSRLEPYLDWGLSQQTKVPPSRDPPLLKAPPHPIGSDDPLSRLAVPDGLEAAPIPSVLRDATQSPPPLRPL